MLHTLRVVLGKIRRALFPQKVKEIPTVTISESDYRIHSYCVEELRSILGDQRLKVVDVGGAVNLQPHYEKLIGNADFYIFEPDERSYNDLINTVDRYSHPTDFNYINKALSGENGKRTLYLSNLPTGTSILKLIPENPFYSKESSYFFPMKEVVIDTYKLETVLNENKIPYFDAIKLDVQGAELEIIKGIDNNRLDEINVIEMEIGVHSVYLDQTTFSDVTAFMASKGFSLFDLRVNRASIPALQDNFSYHEKYLNTHNQSPSVAARLWEFDAIYFREPNWIKGNKKISRERIRRILGLYCMYNFFAEAIQVTNRCLNDGLFTAEEHALILESIISCNRKEQSATSGYDRSLKETNYFFWGQYMQVSYPSN